MVNVSTWTNQNDFHFKLVISIDDEIQMNRVEWRQMSSGLIETFNETNAVHYFIKFQTLFMLKATT